MLRFLGENDGCRQKDIADRFFLRAASVSGVLNTLEKQGLIERRQNPRSRRETLIYLTEQGKDKLVQVHKFYEEINELWFEDFSEDEYEDLMELLGKLQKSLEKQNQKEQEDCLDLVKKANTLYLFAQNIRLSLPVFVLFSF